MGRQSGKHQSVLDTLALVHEQLQAQAGVVEELESQLGDEKEKLKRLEALNESLMQFLPDLGVPATDSEAVTAAPADERRRGVDESELSTQNASQAFAGIDGSLLMQDMPLSILSTAGRPLRVGDLVDAISLLRESGKTDRLGNSKRPDSVVGSALDRLIRKQLVVKVDRGLYTVKRTSAGMEAA